MMGLFHTSHLSIIIKIRPSHTAICGSEIMKEIEIIAEYEKTMNCPHHYNSVMGREERKVAANRIALYLGKKQFIATFGENLTFDQCIDKVITILNK